MGRGDDASGGRTTGFSESLRGGGPAGPNLSLAPDRLRIMFDSQSHPSGERSVDDIVGDEAEARRNLSEGPDTLGAMFDSHPPAESSLDRAEESRRLRAAYAAVIARLAGQSGNPANFTAPEVVFPDHPNGGRDEAEAAVPAADSPKGPIMAMPPGMPPAPDPGEDTTDTQSGGLSPEEAAARYEATAAVLAERGLGPGAVIPDCVYEAHDPTGVGRSDGGADREDLDVLPEGFDDLAAGPALALLLSTVDLARLTGRDAVRVLRAERRQTAHQQARTYRAMAEAAHAVSADTNQRSRHPNTFAADEIAAALTYTRRKADNELRKALRLTRDLPEVHAALEAGVIDDHKAHVIAEAASALPAAAARSTVDKILRSAARLTVGQVKAEMGRLCIEEDPGYAQTRYEQRLERRRLVIDPTSAGTADLSIRDCAPDLAHIANLRVNSIARGLQRAGSSRSHTQLRADVALDLLAGRNADLYADTGGGKAGSVNVCVDLTTLAGLDDNPGELAGYGPVVAEVARKVAAEQQEKSGWSAAVTDPETGEPLHVVSVRRRPTKKQTDMIRALHPVCVFPGCRMPAVNCDLDHRIDHARGGPTTVENHAPLCRHHHRAKHEGGWAYTKIGRTTVEWVSPTGHTYQTGGRSPP